MPDHVEINCRPREISQAILNIVNNAHDAIRFTAGDNWIKIESNELGDDMIELSITDSGTRIPPEIRDKIWEPFYTTKSIGKGSGLGLSLSCGIIKQHGGDIYLDQKCKNTRFVIRFPVAGIIKKSA